MIGSKLDRNPSTLPSNMEVDYSDPESVVISFITEMNKWETEAYKAGRACRDTADPSSYLPEVAARLKVIFERHVVPRERPYGRGGTYSRPPEYNPETERVLGSVLERRHRACVTMERPPPGLYAGRLHYILIRKSDKWLIDNLKREYGGKTTQQIL